MKVKYIILGIFLLSSFSAVAQVGELRNNWSVGINGGVNLNSLRIDPNAGKEIPGIKQKMPMGINGGITARYISEKYFAMICGVQLELNYSQRGWEEDTEGFSYKYSRTMNYLEMPFLAHLAFGRDRGAQFFLNLGPQLGYLISEKEHFEGDWQSVGAKQHGKPADKRFDYGIVGGGGLEIRTGAGNFLLEGRYYFGFADFFNNRKQDYFANSAHTTIQIKLSYLFDITK